MADQGSAKRHFITIPAIDHPCVAARIRAFAGRLGNPEGGGRGGECGGGFAGWRVGLSSLWLSFPLCGHGLSKPLDSSAACSRRRSTTCIHAGGPAPACSRQAGMTAGAAVRFSSRMTKGFSGWRATLFSTRRHSSEGWNPGERPEKSKDCRILQAPDCYGLPVADIPALWE